MNFCNQRTVSGDVRRGLAGVAYAAFATSAAATAALDAFLVVACGLTVVVPLLASILETPRAVFGVLKVDGVGRFLLGSSGVVAAMQV